MHHRLLGAATLALALIAGSAAQADTFNFKGANGFVSQSNYEGRTVAEAYVKFFKGLGSSLTVRDVTVNAVCNPNRTMHRAFNLDTGRVAGFAFLNRPNFKPVVGCRY